MKIHFRHLFWPRRFHRSGYSPQHPLLLYGTMASVSIGKLFIGGFIPGIIMGLGLMVYSYYVGKKRHYVGREQKAPAGEVLKTGKDALLALIMPVIIIGGIMSGIFTATESGADCLCLLPDYWNLCIPGAED